nr:reductive dehalogenase [uncultured bacterium]
MSKFHSTVSRRNFMKGLGLGAAGLSAAAATTPVFKDLDELSASSGGFAEKRPWYIKERDYLDATCEVDWDVQQRFSGANYNNYEAHLTPEHTAQRLADLTEHRRQDCLDNKPGYDLRSRVLAQTGWINILAQAQHAYTADGLSAFDQQPQATEPGEIGIRTPEIYGVPRWEGTPEENATMMRSVIRWAGGGTVGFGKVDDKTVKFINSDAEPLAPGLPPQQIVFEDSEKGYQVPGKQVIPNKCRYVITTAVREQLDTSRYSPTLVSAAECTKGYSQVAITAIRVMTFLRGIGYTSVSGGFGGTWYNNIAWGVMTGLGELSRMKEMITPETGPIIRLTLAFWTDLPLPVTNPIDAGMHKFCHDCRRCADACPSGAIPTYRDPSWDITQVSNSAGNPDHLKPELFNNPGHKSWYLNHFACQNYWGESASLCAICAGSCVFSKLADSSVHELVKGVVATTPALNGFFYNMDKAYGYNDFDDDKATEWWENPDKYQPLHNAFTNY